MTWRSRILLGCGGVILLAHAGIIGLLVWQPWAPPVVLADPSPEGVRVRIAGNPANYFPSHGPDPKPGVLILGGAEGGLGTGSALTARALQQAGYSTLQFSYFRAPGQTSKLARVPLEKFHAALAWLKSQPAVDPERIGVIGTSKGAEAALLLTTRAGDVDAVVAAMPSSHVWQGFSWSGLPVHASSWTERGHDVPSLPFGEGNVFAHAGSVYRSGLKAASAHQDAVLAVERSSARVLLVCGEADTLWPSCPMSRELQKRSPATITVLAYRDAGHAAFGAPAETGFPAGPAAFGGTFEGNRRARSSSWNETIQFLESSFEE